MGCSVVPAPFVSLVGSETAPLHRRGSQHHPTFAGGRASAAGLGPGALKCTGPMPVVCSTSSCGRNACCQGTVGLRSLFQHPSPAAVVPYALIFPLRRAYKAEGRLINNNARLVDANVVMTHVQMSCNR